MISKSRTSINIKDESKTILQNSKNAYGKKKAVKGNFDITKDFNAKSSYLPDIGTDAENQMQMRATIEDLKEATKEKDCKIGALQRNFESISALL